MANGRMWTAEEDALVMDPQGKTMQQLADALGRSRASVVMRRMTLRDRAEKGSPQQTGRKSGEYCPYRAPEIKDCLNCPLSHCVRDQNSIVGDNAAQYVNMVDGIRGERQSVRIIGGQRR